MKPLSFLFFIAAIECSVTNPCTEQGRQCFNSQCVPSEHFSVKETLNIVSLPIRISPEVRVQFFIQQTIVMDHNSFLLSILCEPFCQVEWEKPRAFWCDSSQGGHAACCFTSVILTKARMIQLQISADCLREAVLKPKKSFGHKTMTETTPSPLTFIERPDSGNTEFAAVVSCFKSNVRNIVLLFEWLWNFVDTIYWSLTVTCDSTTACATGMTCSGNRCVQSGRTNDFIQNNERTSLRSQTVCLAQKR